MNKPAFSEFCWPGKLEPRMAGHVDVSVEEAPGKRPMLVLGSLEPVRGAAYRAGEAWRVSESVAYDDLVGRIFETQELAGRELLNRWAEKPPAQVLAERRQALKSRVRSNWDGADPMSRAMWLVAARNPQLAQLAAELLRAIGDGQKTTPHDDAHTLPGFLE